MRPPQDRIVALKALFQSGQPSRALEEARIMAQQFPRSLTAWNIRGAAARALGALDEAEESFRRLQALDPNFAGAPYNLALVLEDRGDRDGAAAAYARALELEPKLAEAHNNLGAILAAEGELERALVHLHEACRLKPGLAQVHISLGNALRRAGRVDEARAAYHEGIRLAPSSASAHYNLGTLEQQQGNMPAAIAAHSAAIAADPGSALARAALIAQLAWVCDWPALDQHREHIPALGVSGEAVAPWPMMALEDAPQRQLARARNWAARRFGTHHAAIPARPRARPERLKVGYFSADYHDHPGARQISGLFRSHDRTRFEIHAFSYGAKRDDPYRREAEGLVDRFHDVAGWPSARIVDLARTCGLDIAVDRQGYTTDSRTDLFQHRLAPVQIEYLGYPGPVAAPFIDYMIADPVTVPDSHRAHYPEKLIRLPCSYAPLDNTLPIDPQAPSRADLGLPEDGFVLCCFNATYKITPREYDIWMRIMRDVPGSVLWLFRSNDHVAANLQREAQRRGVEPERIVFAGRVPNPAHLARHAHADLFVDTFAVNAHTTTADALWAGLPVVTRMGDQFAARVAASFLEAAGLPECITHSDGEYEALIRDLAQDRARLAGLRAKLAENRAHAPLFDTALYTRHFEQGLEAAYERYWQGLAPADIDVGR